MGRVRECSERRMSARTATKEHVASGRAAAGNGEAHTKRRGAVELHHQRASACHVTESVRMHRAVCTRDVANRSDHA
jgi:hypothetical protein